MNPVVFGLLAGLVFGAVDVALMLPMDFPDKRTALLGAFLTVRAFLGCWIPMSGCRCRLGGRGSGRIPVSLPDASSRAYAPILASGHDRRTVIGGRGPLRRLISAARTVSKRRTTRHSFG